MKFSSSDYLYSLGWVVLPVGGVEGDCVTTCLPPSVSWVTPTLLTQREHFGPAILVISLVPFYIFR